MLKLVLPSSSELSPVVPDPASRRVQLVLTYLELAFDLLAFYTVGTTQRCAPMGKTPARASSPPSANAESFEGLSPDEHPPAPLVPATGFLSCSPISFVLFAWISPVLKVGEQVESLSQSDLPVLGARDRAPNLWSQIQASSAVGRGPRFVNGLLWRIIRTNQALFTAQVVMAFVTSFIYYIPAALLQKLVAFLEDRPLNEDGSFDNRWGYIYCLSFLAAGLADATCQGQLWFLSVTMLATRIKVQVNCLIFDKTLKRKDVAGTSQPKTKDAGTVTAAVEAGAEGGALATPDGKGPVAAAAEDEDGEEEEGKETFDTKNSVLNLFR